jgi:predicted alpha/beta superfamily hydrolase
MLRTILTVFALFTAMPAEAQPAIVSEGAYAPANTQQFVLRSNKLGHDMLVVVAAPRAGGIGVTGQRSPDAKLPAIYALDNGWEIAGPVGQMMSYMTAMSPAYVVSIGYPPGTTHRDTDLLFEPVTENGKTFGGGGARFLAFLTDELGPWLEARYPIDRSKAILFGHSFGGLFTANALATKPDAFGGYVIGSPSVRYDPDVVERIAEVASSGGGRRVFVSAGEHEGYGIPEGATAIAAALSGAGSTFQARSRVYAGEGHISYYPRLAPEAFAWVLPPAVKQQSDAVALSAEALERVTGKYKLADGRVIAVWREDGKTLASMTGINGFSEIFPESENRFFFDGYDSVLIFEIPPRGPAVATVLRVNGVELRAVRQ